MPVFGKPDWKLAMNERPRRLFGPSEPISFEEPEAPTDPMPEVQPQQVSEAPKEGFGKKLGRIFGVSSPRPEVDEYGLQKPAMEKEGVGMKALNYLLPTVIGLAGGAGLSGLAAAHAGDRARKDERAKLFQKEQAEYNDAFAKMANPTKPGDQKNFEWLESLDPDKRDRALAYKASSNPLGMMNFDYKLQRDKLEDQRREEERGEKITERREERLDKDVQKLSTALKDTQDLDAAARDVEAVLGFKLEDFDAKTQMANGKKIDLPGANIPGIGRLNFYSGDARALEGAMSRIYNTLLKVRSGAAVTNPEFDRFIREFEAGKFNTEGEMLRGLQRFKKGLNTTMKNIESGFKPEAVQEYQQRGGLTSGARSRKPATIPNNRTPRIQEAVEWAQQNPNDPDAQKILQRYGS